MINYLFEANKPLISSYFIKHRDYFNLIFIKSTQLFFSYGLSLDDGFETNNFVNKIVF